MNKYIDAEKLKTHIQYLIKKDNYELFDVPELLSFIDSLQQEQSEVELNEETLRKEFHTIDRQCFEEGIEGWQREKLIARHFYELGLNARKEG